MPLLAWTAFLAGALAVLHNVGGPLEPPPLTDPSGWGGWLEGREPPEAAFAVVRLMVLGMAWYLLAVTMGGTVARLAGAHLLVRAADAVTIPLVRRLVSGALGVSVAAAASITGTASAATNGHLAQASPVAAAAAEAVYSPPPAPGADSPPTMQRLPDPPADPADSFRATSPPPGPLPAGTDGTTRVTTPAPPPPPAGTDAPVPPPPAAPPRTTWTVRPGDHFWSVAEQVLAEAWGRAPSDREVDPYWRSLVEANRPILRDPANADLLFPDQVIQVSPPPPAPAP